MIEIETEIDDEFHFLSSHPPVEPACNQKIKAFAGSWKICSLAVNGQSFLVIDGYLLNP
eukprot:UN3471